MSGRDREQKLHILIALLYYLPHHTGLTLHVQRVAEELVRRGHTVTVLSARFRPELAREERINGVRVVRLWPLPLHISRGMLLPAYPWAAARLIRDHDLVWVQTPLLETALLAWLARRAGRPLVVTHHGDLVLGAGLFNRLISATMFRLYTYLARRARRLFAYSEDYATHSHYLRPFADKVSVIHPPILIPQPERQQAQELRAEWAAEGGPIIGFCGRFVAEKRPDLLLRSLEIIREHYPTVRLIFAGEYDIRYENFWRRCRSLRERFAEHLRFLGSIDDPQQLANFYAACDVLALTSDTECFALVQVEAMLCGTPVVMTDTPGGRVPVRVTGMGRLAKVGDWRSIGENLLAVLEEPERYQRPRAEIQQMFSFAETVDRYEEHFYRALGRRVGPLA